MTTYADRRTKKQKQLDAAVKERVLRGIELLEAAYGRHWVDKMDLESFQISDGSCCVLGQVYGDYYDGCQILGIQAEEDDPRIEMSAAHYGFIWPDGESALALQQAWLEEIT